MVEVVRRIKCGDFGRYMNINTKTSVLNPPSHMYKTGHLLDPVLLLVKHTNVQPWVEVEEEEEEDEDGDMKAGVMDSGGNNIHASTVEITPPIGHPSEARQVYSPR